MTKKTLTHTHVGGWQYLHSSFPQTEEHREARALQTTWNQSKLEFLGGYAQHTLIDFCFSA